MANDALLTALLIEVESMQREMNGRIERLKAFIEQEQRKAMHKHVLDSTPGPSILKSALP